MRKVIVWTFIAGTIAFNASAQSKDRDAIFEDYRKAIAKNEDHHQSNIANCSRAVGDDEELFHTCLEWVERLKDASFRHANEELSQKIHN